MYNDSNNDPLCLPTNTAYDTSLRNVSPPQLVFRIPTHSLYEFNHILQLPTTNVQLLTVCVYVRAVVFSTSTVNRLCGYTTVSQ